MKRFRKLQNRLTGLTNAIARYPVTELFLIAGAVIVAVSINTEKDYTRQFLTCVVGAVLCASLQAAYERFFHKMSSRLVLMGCGVILTLGYFLILKAAPELSIEISIRTSIALLALCIAFIWVPVIRSRISFNESFMIAFKALFHAIFYAVIIFIGCSLINAAVDNLIIRVSYKCLSHIANIVFVLFAPLFFLSLIPVYPGIRTKDMDSVKTKTQDELIEQAAFCPKFLEILISYIIIPITAVFTIILLLYIVLNIRREFWTNNLLEPMLVSYAITVIMITILSSRLENNFAVLFRRFFPKILIPIMLFQIASSIISLRDTGVTHTRYFVILFGIFAASAGVVMSFVSVQKNGIIAAMLVVFSIVSVIPPIDAFTVSRLNQENILKSVLLQNEMLKNNTITPNASISDEDKKKIVSVVQYLSMMSYADKIAWMPDDFSVYADFYDTFGFNEYDVSENTNQSINVFLNSLVPIEIAGYDFMVHTKIDTNENITTKICDIQKSGKNYTMKKEKAGQKYDIVLNDDNDQELIRFHTDEIFTKYSNYAIDKSELSNEEATFTTENSQIKLTVIIQNANINESMNRIYDYADLYLLVQFK